MRRRQAKRRKSQARAGAEQALKWIGAGTIVFGVLPVAAILVRDIPGIIRELKIERMGWRGGWKQAHRPLPPGQRH